MNLFGIRSTSYDGEEVFLQTFGAVPRDRALLFAAHFCASQVFNGGFEQFFWNSTGVLAPEAIEGFRAVGQVKVAAVVEAACAVLHSQPYPRGREARQELLDAVESGAFDRLNEEFWTLAETEGGGFNVAADRYSSAVRSTPSPETQ